MKRSLFERTTFVFISGVTPSPQLRMCQCGGEHVTVGIDLK